MKKLLLILLCLPIIGFGQWHDLSIGIDHNIEGYIHQDINITGKITTETQITKIDYGKIALANAQREEIRLNKLLFDEERNQRIGLEILKNPIKSINYGPEKIYKINVKKKDYKKFKELGLKKYDFYYREPYGLLFDVLGWGNFQYLSEDGIIVQIRIYLPEYNIENSPILNQSELEEYWSSNREITVKPFRSAYDNQSEYMQDLKRYEKQINNIDQSKKEPLMSAETIASHPFLKEQENIILEGSKSVFLHKKDINKAIVFRNPGFIGTLFYEDNYEFTIEDKYLSYAEIGNGIFFYVKVKYFGDKDLITFRELENRKTYLKPLVDKLVSLQSISNVKY